MRKRDPPLQPFYPPFSGAAMWAQSLLDRVRNQKVRVLFFLALCCVVFDSLPCSFLLFVAHRDAGACAGSFTKFA